MKVKGLVMTKATDLLQKEMRMAREENGKGVGDSLTDKVPPHRLLQHPRLRSTRGRCTSPLVNQSGQ